MILPEVVYRLNDRDLAGQLIELVNLNESQSVASPSLQNALWYTVPLDKILVVQSIRISAVPGAAQTFNNVAVMHNRNSALTEGYVFHRSFHQAAAVQVQDTHSPGCGYIVPSGNYLRFLFSFTGGAVANGCSISLSALLIPRGNVVI